MSQTLVVATQNVKKAKEIEAFFGEELTVRTLADFPQIEMPPETADTFEGNAVGKAEYVATVLSLPVLADDSGLEVDALGGQPGVRSARYAPGSDADRVQHLLAELSRSKSERTSARFVCAMAFARPVAETIVERGVVEGRIIDVPTGDQGFGYDPVFVPEGESRTMAELSLEEKQAISHRGQALRLMLPHLAKHFSLA